MKHQNYIHLILGITTFLLVTAVHGAQAAQDRWFRVELLVFRHDSGGGKEAWEPTPELRYPDAVRFLVEPDRVASNSARHAGDSTVDEFGRQIIANPNASSTGTPASDPQTADSPAASGLPTPFQVLPAGQREFRGKAAYMQRTGRYTTLFHEAWLQPVTARANTLPLVLDRSGDTGEWPLLQGSITLHLSRYLHLETNLWLNTAGDYLTGTWRMPAPPLGPPSLILEEFPGDDEPAPYEAGFVTPQASGDISASQGIEEVQEPPYPFRHAVLLKQKRRMRSKEVHYLDHPLVGIVVKLVPLTAEDLALMAAAEDSGNYPPLDN